MLTCDEMIDKVNVLYEGRRTGDTSGFAKVQAPDATFRFAGEASIVAQFPGHGSQDLDTVARDLFNTLTLHKKRTVTAVAEGNRLAANFVLTLQNEYKNRAQFEQEVFDLWTFNDAGQIASGLQFQDTAKIIAELA